MCAAAGAADGSPPADLTTAGLSAAAESWNSADMEAQVQEQAQHLSRCPRCDGQDGGQVHDGGGDTDRA